MNILTIDLEDWFHLLDHDKVAGEAEWENYPTRLREGLDILLKVLQDTNTRGTFFIIGWIARKYPEITREIDALGYEIACQSDKHRLVHSLTPKTFLQDTTNAIHHLEDIIGKKVTGYRAPGFSITPATPWAFPILSEAGITYDSSVFPTRHSHGGYPGFPSKRPCRIRIVSSNHDMFPGPPVSIIKEFPISIIPFSGRNIVFSGGGYFRLFPYSFINSWTKRLDYNMAYIHPRDVDPGQPLLPGLSPFRRFKSYYGIKGTEKKLRRWLTDFRFTDIRNFDKTYDWEQSPIVGLQGSEIALIDDI